jgi:hypothetical protein
VLSRPEILSALIGQPWAWQSRNCWDFACHVQSEVFSRELPCVAVPRDLSKRWILESIERHPERAAWREVPDGPGGLVTAADGALVLRRYGSAGPPSRRKIWPSPLAGADTPTKRVVIFSG